MKSCCIHISFVPCAADWIVPVPVFHLRELMSIIRAEFLSIQNNQNENIYWGSSWLCPLCFLDDESHFWRSWLLPGWECLGWVHALSQCDWPHVASWIWQSTHKPCSWDSDLCFCGKGLGVSGLQEQPGGHLVSSQGITDRLWWSLLGHSWCVLYCKGSERPRACHCSEVLSRQTPPKSVCQGFPFQEGCSAKPFLPLHERGMSISKCWLKKCSQLLVLNT